MENSRTRSGTVNGGRKEKGAYARAAGGVIGGRGENMRRRAFDGEATRA